MKFSDIKLGSRVTGDQPASMNAVQVVAITSGDAGAGKTSIALNIAHAFILAGQRCMLLDAGSGDANVSSYLGLHPEYSLLDVLDGSKRIDEVIVHAPSGLALIPAASSISRLASLDVMECAGLVRAFSDIDTQVDSLIIDASCEKGQCVASLCKAAGEVVVVVSDSRASVDAGVELISRLHLQHGISKFRILPNLVASARDAGRIFSSILQHFVADHQLSLTCCGFMPTDIHMQKAAELRQSVLGVYPRSRAAMALKNLAWQFMRWPKSWHPGGHLEFFVERLIQNENIIKEARS